MLHTVPLSQVNLISIAQCHKSEICLMRLYNLYSIQNPHSLGPLILDKNPLTGKK